MIKLKELPKGGKEVLMSYLDYKIDKNLNVFPYFKPNEFIKMFSQEPDYQIAILPNGEKIKVDVSEGRRHEYYYNYSDEDLIKEYNGDYYFSPPCYSDFRSINVTYKGNEYTYFFDKGSGWGSTSFGQAHYDCLKIITNNQMDSIIKVKSNIHLSDLILLDYTKFPFLELVGYTHDSTILRMVSHKEAFLTNWDKSSNLYECVKKYKSSGVRINDLLIKSIGRYLPFNNNKWKISELIEQQVRINNNARYYKQLTK